MKKILSIALALTMVFAFAVALPATAAAAPAETIVEGASVSATVDKLNGNQNNLWITVADGSGTTVQNFAISNNAEGVYSVRTEAGCYTVYVDTKGNTQIRACYVASFSATCDTVIKNGDVRTMDGGKTAEAIGIKDGKVLFVGSNKKAEEHIGAITTVIDANGAVVAPGFVDLHTHADNIASGNNRLAENYLRQGVTTVLGGNCGSGSARVNVAGHLSNVMASGGPAINYATLVGYYDMRSAARIPDSVTNPSESQIAAMSAYMEQAMLDGAFGLS
ncbi:MAG: amidohydrolase family protein, partial [Clostridiales bacterium]|nr:amidohydrolase family protein [Clostridiales bacterium]